METGGDKTQGVKIIFRSGSRVLGVRSEDSCDLPSAKAGSSAADLQDATLSLFRNVTGSPPEKSLIPAYRGWDEEFGVSSSYVCHWDGSPRSPRGCKTDWVDVTDVMRGRWGLFARDAFHNIKLINRPPLDLREVYRICKKATYEGSAGTTDAIDRILDEIVLLTDIDKSYALDDLLKVVQVEKLHADVLAAMIAFVEDRTDLPTKAEFVAKANQVVEAIDGPRRRFPLKDEYGRIISKDVRADALKYYRKKAKEFGDQLRAGTLGEGLHRGGAPLKRRRAN